jgi:signal transduction histidine kinase
MRTGRLPARLRRRWRSRTAVIAGMIGFVVSVYVVVVLAGGVLIGRTSSPSVPLSVLATVIVALLFSRVQAALERAVARAVHDGAASPYDLLSRFSENLTTADPTDRLPLRMAQLLAEGTGAQWAQVWLVVTDRLVLAATWPTGADADPQAPPLNHAPDHPGYRPGRKSLPVVHGGQVLAVLTLQERHNLALTPVEQRLFSGLAGQAGPVLQGVALQAALKERHEELLAQAGALQASRQRLIDTQDAERRRLERDMHDGAQQHLVALAVNLRVAQTVADRSPHRATEVLAAQAGAAVQTIATLTSLSRGIYPRLLTDGGLMVALRSALTASPIPVTVRPAYRDLSGMTAPVHAALYFCALEAVQNAAKHSSASQVTLMVKEHQDCWTMSVNDDGRGFDVHDSLLNASAGGLLNMEDRLSAVGGSLRVDSPPGGGTTVTARVPREARFA